MKPQAIAIPSKAYDGKKFTYASPEDSWLKQKIIGAVEVLTGRKHLQKIYDELHAAGPNPFDVWGDALEKLDIGIDFDFAQLEKIPKEGPVIFVANHPFGVVDGAIFLDLVTRVRKDYFILINEVLTHEPFLKDHLLPVDFRGDKRAMETNLETKRQTTERLKRGEALVIFPSGGVATSRKFFGKVEELPWRRFICTRIHETKCTVVPFYFHGKNSPLFQFVSKFSMNLRLGLLLNEVMNKRGERLKVEMREPIPYAEMQDITDRQELIEFLHDKTVFGN
jgi:putative hemolysin